MIYIRRGISAYLAKEGETVGMVIDGADLAQLERVLAKFTQPADREDVLRCFYERAESKLGPKPTGE